MSKNENIKSFYIGTMITSFVGGVLLLFTDFAGWDGSNAYLGFYSWGWIGPNLDEPLSIIPFLLLACLLFYCTYVSYLGFSDGLVTYEIINRAFLFSAGVLAIVFFGALFFIISVIADDVWWWFEAGFYGGIIGSFLSTIFLYQIRKSTPM